MLSLSDEISRQISKMSGPILRSSIVREVRGQNPSLGLDIGCGPQPRNYFGVAQLYGIDLNANPERGVLAGDLSSEPIAFGDSAVDIVTCFDFLEHIPRWERRSGQVCFPLVDLFSEIYRVLKPGGFLYAETPLAPLREAFQDPTHVNFVNQKTFSHYFAGPGLASIYGFRGTFLLVRQGREKGHLLTLMKKTKF